MMADLTWKLEEIKYGCEGSNDWITASPETGDETTRLNVKIKATTSDEDCKTATIIISSSTGEKKEIPIERCMNSTSCDYIGFVVNDEIPKKLPKKPSEEEKKLLLGTYSTESEIEFNIDVDGEVLSDPTYEDGKAYAIINDNTTDAERSGDFKIYIDDESEPCVSKTVVQEGDGSGPVVDDCKCGTVGEKSGPSSMFDWDTVGEELVGWYSSLDEDTCEDYETHATKIEDSSSPGDEYEKDSYIVNSINDIKFKESQIEGHLIDIYAFIQENTSHKPRRNRIYLGCKWPDENEENYINLFQAGKP